MFGTHDLLLFVISGLLLNVTPGPDTLYIVRRCSTQGLRAGVAAALGTGAGPLVHITAAALGLPALLAASACTFFAWSAARISTGIRRSVTMAKWFTRCVGGLFVYLGIRLALDEAD